ncbi:orotidine 5'-phosphate decarboxylase, partial [Agrococcus sp. HG114]|nr:orotidine 5'-phosphate decarboxylase [Agrococcus sp. HG114]
GRTVARAVADEVAARNAATGAGHGLVIGATLDRAVHGIEPDASTPVLAPGFGAQGARLGDLHRLFPPAALVLASASRSILGAGAEGLADAIEAARAELP